LFVIEFCCRPETKENKEGADTEKTAENDTEKELEKDKVSSI
jgi:hypothetical protein